MRGALEIKGGIGPGVFRLLLALVVFVHHASSLALGLAAVEVFFCLSGFWIYKMWTERYVRSENPYVTYLISRAWRLIPTFVLVAVLTLIFQHYFLDRSWATLRGAASWPHFIISHLFIFGYNRLPAPPLVPAWSLDVEMQFYLIAPILMVSALRFGALPLVVGASATSIACALLLGSPGGFLTFAVFFALGIAAARQGWRPSRRSAAICAGMAALMVVGLAASPWKGALFGGAHRDVLFRYSEAVNTVVALLLFPYAIFTTRQHGRTNEAFFGDLSYVVYLLHWIAVEWLGRQAGLPVPARLACGGLALAATFSGAWVIWKFYDKPLNRARARWVSARVGEPTLSVGGEPSAP